MVNIKKYYLGKVYWYLFSMLVFFFKLVLIILGRGGVGLFYELGGVSCFV